MRHEEYACMRAVEDRHWWYGGLHALVLDALCKFGHPESVVADIGCGTGGMGVKLPSNYMHVGLDMAPEALRLSGQRGLQRLMQADAVHLPLADGSVDGALLLDVLYHSGVTDREGVLREAHRIVRPGGLVLVNVPAYQWLYSSHDVAVHTAHRFTRGEIDTLLQSAGFEIVLSSYWNTALLPAIAACRFALRWRADRGSDLDPDTPAWVNKLLGGVLRLERGMMQLAPLPAGVSIFVVARKT